MFGALGYCTVSDVKLVLQISEATWDSELTACVTSAGALVDGLLAREGLIVPSPTPQVVVDAAKLIKLVGMLLQTKVYLFGHRKNGCADYIST